MNLLEYLESLNLNEANQPTLKDLIDQFDKVFPYSEKDLRVINYHIDGKDSNDARIIGTVAASVDTEDPDNPKEYKVLVELHRDNLETPWMLSMVGKVNCYCPAFRYNLAYPDAKNNVLGGKIMSYNRIPNKIRNGKQIPSICKHLYAFLHYLYNKKVLLG